MITVASEAIYIWGSLFSSAKHPKLFGGCTPTSSPYVYLPVCIYGLTDYRNALWLHNKYRTKTVGFYTITNV